MKHYTKLATFFPACFFGVFCFFGFVVVDAAPGDLDTSFGGDGVIELTPMEGDYGPLAHLAEMLPQRDGKLITNWWDGMTGELGCGSRRLNLDGSADRNYVGGCFAMIQEADGRYLALHWHNAINREIVLRYDHNLSPASQIGVTTDFIQSFGARIALQGSEKFVVWGRLPGTGEFALKRFFSDGSVDIEFGANGQISISEWAVLFGFHPDGGVLIRTTYYTIPNSIIKFRTDGTLDTAFGSNGRIVVPGAFMSLQPDGKLIYWVKADSDSMSQIWIARRLNLNGSADGSFGTNGQIVISVPVSSAEAVSILTIQENGKILFGVTSSGNDQLIRFNGDGSLDLSFGIAGRVTITSLGTRVMTFAVTGGNKVLAAGQYDPACNCTRIARYDSGYAVGPTPTPTPTPMPMPSGSAAFDYDGDGSADPSIFRPDGGDWWIKQPGGGYTQQQWGNAPDRIAPADYDGDGKTDIAIFRPSDGNWWVMSSLTSTFSVQQWGDQNDVIVPGDYTGDGKADHAIWRPTDGHWWILDSSNGQYMDIHWGIPTDKPVPADYDGNGTFDIMAYRPSEGNWYLRLPGGGYTVTQWGDANDKLVPADYTGDGKADLAIWRPTDSHWWILDSSTGQYQDIHWGNSTDMPVPADFDGNGETNIAIWRPADGVWWILNDTGGGFTQTHWGSTGDRPTPNAYVR